MRLLALLASLCLLDGPLTHTAHALRLSGRRVAPHDVLARRASMSSSADLNNLQDLKYFTNISLNEQVFPVLIDTGRCVFSIW